MAFAPAARKYRPTDLVDLAESRFKGLTEEMTMLRVYMRGVIEQSSSASSLSESIEVLRAGLPVAMAAASLTRMARTQKYLDGSGTTLEGLSEILAEANEKLRREGVHE